MNEVWYDIEWYDGALGWRSSKRQLTREDAIAQMRVWNKEYQCRLIRIEKTRTVEAI